MLNEMDAKIGKTKEVLKQFGYDRIDVSAKEFYDWMTGEIFSDDPTTLRDVLGNEYIMVTNEKVWLLLSRTRIIDNI